jgi:GFO/IDH/MocA oxidoreductase family protein
VSDPKSRRFFLGALTAASAVRVWGANDKMNVLIVGVGGRGGSHIDGYSRDIPEARVAAICDVNQAAREIANTRLERNKAEKAKEFVDMREAFASPGIDVVSIATPNHWHVLATIWAMKAGKDVYCEKPASYNIHEGLEVLKVQRETKKLVQIGSQHRSTPFKMKAFQAMHQGLIGKIYMAKGLCFKRRPSIGHTPDSATPAGLNWDLFLGPAPMRAYNEKRYKYFWHWFWDTGNGDIGNQGVHEMGICRWALQDPDWPKTAVAFGGKYVDDDTETPNTLLAGYNYGDREIMFEVRGNTTGGEGVRQGRVVTAGPSGAGGRAGRGRGNAPQGVEPPAAPPAAPAPTQTGPASNPINVGVGNLFYGTEGWAAMSDQGFQAYKGDSSELVMEERPERGPDNTTVLHMKNFLSAVKSRNEKELHDPLSNAVLSAGLCHLANISYRSGGNKLTLQPGPKFDRDNLANSFLTRESYRKPYVV